MSVLITCMEQERSACYITNSIQQIISLFWLFSLLDAGRSQRRRGFFPGPVRVRFVVDKVTKERVVSRALKCSHIIVIIPALSARLHVRVTVNWLYGICCICMLTAWSILHLYADCMEHVASVCWLHGAYCICMLTAWSILHLYADCMEHTASVCWLHGAYCICMLTAWSMLHLYADCMEQVVTNWMK